jgi:hypothetical protein
MELVTLQDHPSVESFFTIVETETFALFEHLSFEFLDEFDVFAPPQTGRTRDHEPPARCVPFSTAITAISTGFGRSNGKFTTPSSGSAVPSARRRYHGSVESLDGIGIGR